MGSVTFHRVDIVMNRLTKIGGGAPRYLNDVLDRIMSKDIWPKWVEHTTLTDHDLEDLRRLGHPYSVRFGKDSFMHPDSEVHRQSGSLSESSSIQKSGTGGEMSIRLIAMSPHYVFLRYGTRYMRIRDPGAATLRDALPLIKKRFADEVRAAIVKIYVG